MNSVDFIIPLLFCTSLVQAASPTEGDFYEQNTRRVATLQKALPECHSMRIYERVVRGKDEGRTSYMELTDEEQSHWRHIISSLKPLKQKGSKMKLPRSMFYLQMLNEQGEVYYTMPMDWVVKESELPDGRYGRRATMYIPGQ